MTATVPTPLPAASPTHPLSLNQEFLRAFDTGGTDGAFGAHHVLAGAWRVTGSVDADVLADALRDVVDRHEVLRTTIARGAAAALQTVHPPTDPELTVLEASDDGRPRDVLAEELLNEVDATPLPVDVLPHLRAVLARFDATDAVLVLTTHHTATDGWSLGLIARDVVACYAARTAGGAPPPAPPSYGAFADAQQDIAQHPAVGPALEHWRERLAGGRIVAIPVDRSRRPGTVAAYGAHRFALDQATSAAVRRTARGARSTPFMVLLAAYVELLRERTGAADVVVPSFTSGRYDPAFADTVGPFFNMCPLRVDTTGCGGLGDVLARVRATVLDAFAHEVPFALVAGVEPELTAAFGDEGGAVVAFEVLQSPAEPEVPAGDLRFTELRRRTISQRVSSGIPNGALWAMDVLPSGEIVGSLKYDANHFDVATVTDLVDRFAALLRAGTADATDPQWRNR